MVALEEILIKVARCRKARLTRNFLQAHVGGEQQLFGHRQALHEQEFGEGLVGKLGPKLREIGLADELAPQNVGHADFAAAVFVDIPHRAVVALKLVVADEPVAADLVEELKEVAHGKAEQVTCLLIGDVGTGGAKAGLVAAQHALEQRLRGMRASCAARLFLKSWDMPSRADCGRGCGQCFQRCSRRPANQCSPPPQCCPRAGARSGDGCSRN